MTGRNTRAIVAGTVLAVVGLILVFGALGPLTEDRDADGYYMGDSFTVDRPSHAIITDDIDFLRGRYETVIESSVALAFMGEPDDVRMQGTASGSNELFMGIAATSAVDEYLDGVAHDEITEWEYDLASIRDLEYTTQEGRDTPNAPGGETFWVASVAGTGPQMLDWTIEPGDWTAVIMHADGSSPLTAELAFGAAPPTSVTVVAWTTGIAGLVSLIAGGVLLYRGIRRRTPDSTPTPPEFRNEQ